MSRKRPCCVPSCNDTTAPRHRFPLLERDMFEAWLKAVDNEKLKDLTHEQIHRSYYVCHRHFAEEDVVMGTKRGLTRGAIPSLFLEGITNKFDNFRVLIK